MVHIYGLKTLLNKLDNLSNRLQLITVAQKNELSEITRMLLHAEKLLEEKAEKNQWIPCDKITPANEQEVEISYVRRYIGAGDEKKEYHGTARAFYTDGTMTTEESAFYWEDTDNWEYDEESDSYIIPEGWWESVSFSEEYGVVDAEVIAWRPCPEPYKEE